MKDTYDVCIVGGGVVGLWTARHLATTGLSVVLLDRERCGSGASGGILGALMAHAPDNWNPKKQFQFDALTALPALVDQIETETGIETGYVRCGRIMPVRHERFRDQAVRRQAGAATHWQGADEAFQFAVSDHIPHGCWLSPEAAPLGVIVDTLAARVDPQRYIASLKVSVIQAGVAVLEGTAFAGFDAATRRVAIEGQSKPLAADQIVVAAGYQSFDLLNDLIGSPLGTGVKGQAALFHCPSSIGQYLIYDDGVYVVPHCEGFCAVGSTSEKQWTLPNVPDETRTEFVERAMQLCPQLRDARFIRSWAGVRPRSLRTDPIIGRLEPGSPILLATGGYKITFGIAHHMGKRVADEIVGADKPLPLPPSFAPAHHLGDGATLIRPGGRRT